MKKPSINKAKTSFTDLSYFIRAGEKFGKSTLAKNLILEKYENPERGLLIPIGSENGIKLLDNLNTFDEPIKTYKEMREIKQWLIKERGKEHNIEIVVLDTIDEFIPLIEKEVIRVSNIENPKKQVKTLNASLGGLTY